METFNPQALPDRPPEIPGYDAVRCLGSGAQGQVWLMAPRNGSAPVAAKFLTPPAGVGPDDMNTVAERHNDSQVTHEWRVLAQFRHEHLIAVHGLVQDSDGGQVLIMDYAAGGSLGQIVHARGPLTVGETVTVLTPMGQVLAFLHGRGTVHGDVSPGNILLSAAGKPLLADFGFGRLLGQGEGSPTGTPGFHCPQDNLRDEAADVFALAGIGWFALTGKTAPPTHDRLPLGTFVRNVPAELVAALEAGLNENPAQRPSAAAFAQAIFRSAPAESLALGSAVHPSILVQLPTRQAPTGRRGRFGRAGLAGVAGGAGGAVTAGAAGRRPRQPRPPRAHPRQVLSGSLDAGQFRPGHFRRGTARRRQEPTCTGWRGLLLLGARRKPARLSHLWDSRPHPGGRSGQIRKRLTFPVLATGATVVAAVVLAAAVVFGGSWAGMIAGGTARGPVEETPGIEAVEADMAWAVGLPAEIQRGLTSVEPVAALHALAWVRGYALSNVNQGLIDMVNAPGSAALGADSKIVQELLERTHTLTGLEMKVSHARILSSQAAPNTSPAGTRPRGGAVPAPGDTVTVQASITTSAFAEQDQAGALIHRNNVEQVQELGIVMEQVGARWRIQQILAAGTQ